MEVPVIACRECFKVSVMECEDLLISLGLAADTEFTWSITDKFNTVYAGDVTTDGAGEFIIELDDLPPSLLNPFAGNFLLQVFNTDHEAVPFNLNGQEYTCIDLTVFAGQGNTRVPDPSVEVTEVTP